MDFPMRNSRNHLLINPRFQLHFAFLFSLATLVFTGLFLIFSFGLLDILEKTQAFQNHAESLQALHQARANLLYLFIILGTVIAICSFLLALFHSHRIAGPLYKLRLSMIAMQQGVLDQHIRFRTKDNFGELADGFNSMTDAIFVRRRKDFEKVQSVIPKLERLNNNLDGEDHATVAEVLNALRELNRDVLQK